MPKIVVRLDQKTVQELELSGGKITIGRSEDNTVKLEDDAVSRHHAEIIKEGERYLLSDLGSANGTYVGKMLIARNYELKQGDVIKIGPYTISFRESTEEKPTQVVKMATAEKPTEIFTFSSAPRLIVRSGAEVGQIHDLAKNPLIGRSPECDIVLSEPSVSRRHARIQFIDNRLSIMDVGSKTGTRVNGKLIDRPTQLKDGDRIQIGEVLLEIEWKGGGPSRIEAEQPTTVSFKTPEMTETTKAEWGKWIVGIIVAVAIVVAVIYFSSARWFRRSRGYELLISDAEVLFNEGRENSQMEKLQLALMKIDSALRVQPSEKAKWLKQNIQHKINDLTESQELTKNAEDMLRKGEHIEVIRYTKMALEKDRNNPEARSLKIQAHRVLATKYELAGDSAKERGKDYRADDFYGQAVKEWNEVLALNASDPEALRKKADIQRKILRPAVSQGKATSRVRQTGQYEKALAAYREGRLTEASGIVKIILAGNPNHEKAKQLMEWIDIWNEANYFLNLRNDSAKAKQKFEELLRKDPDNRQAQDWIRTLSGEQ